VWKAPLAGWSLNGHLPTCPAGMWPIFEFLVPIARIVPGFVFGVASALKHLPGLFQVCFLWAFYSKGLTRFVPGLF